jgi:hypothetical protein
LPSAAAAIVFIRRLLVFNTVGRLFWWRLLVEHAVFLIRRWRSLRFFDAEPGWLAIVLAGEQRLIRWAKRLQHAVHQRRQQLRRFAGWLSRLSRVPGLSGRRAVRWRQPGW